MAMTPNKSLLSTSIDISPIAKFTQLKKCAINSKYITALKTHNLIVINKNNKKYQYIRSILPMWSIVYCN